MKNQHIPFELIEQLQLWVNKNVVLQIADDRTTELKKVLEIIDYHHSISIEVSEDLQKSAMNLKRLSTHRMKMN